MEEQEEINKANEDAKKIVLLFVKDFFGEEAEKKADQVIDLINIGVDYDPKIAELCPAYCNGKDEIYITEKCINEYRNSIYIIICLIHEYAHIFSKQISKGTVNDVVEEALANLFVEITIKYYIQKGNKINYVSENENNELIRNLDIYRRSSYISEGDFTRAIMFALRTKKKDIKALGEYYFGNKNNFVDICENTIGPQLREVLIDDLMKVDIHRGVNNKDLYLPQASRKLRNILENYFNFLIDELDISEQESELYSAEGSLMEAIYFENELEHAWLPQIGFTNIRKGNIELLSSNVDIEALQELGDRNIEKMRLNCSKWGYSDFIKDLIRKWYYANKEDEASFEIIMSLTSAIPFDVFLEIM